MSEQCARTDKRLPPFVLVSSLKQVKVVSVNPWPPLYRYVMIHWETLECHFVWK